MSNKKEVQKVWREKKRKRGKKKELNPEVPFE